MLNVSVRKETTKVNPSIINTVNIQSESKLNKIKSLSQKPIIKRNIDNSSIKIINEDGTVSPYEEVTQDQPVHHSDEAVNPLGLVEINPEQNDINVTYPIHPSDKAINPVGLETEIEKESKQLTSDLKLDVVLEYIKLLREYGIIKPLKFVISSDELAKLVLMITQADEVNITLNSDVGCGLMSKEKLVENIYVLKNNERKDFKLFYPTEYTYIRDLKINMKKVL